MNDISLWVMLNDVKPRQQCAENIVRLCGSARKMANTIQPPKEVMNDGFPHGVTVDAMKYLLGLLQAEVSASEEENRLIAIT